MDYSFLLSLYIKEQPEFLDECLNSLYNQPISPSETVIVFDGPITDQLEAVVFKWKDKLLIKTVRLEKNMGLGIALNYGLKNCTYNIVARADTDDIYLPTRMEEQLNFLKNNPDCTILGCNIIEFKKTPGDLKTIRKTPETNEQIKSYSKSRNPFNHMTIVYKKEHIESLGGYQHHLFMEDYNLWIRSISANKKMHNLQRNLVYMRVGENNNMIKRRKGIDYIKSEIKLFKLIKQNKINKTVPAFIICTLRSASRLLNNHLLSIVYSNLRSRK